MLMQGTPTLSVLGHTASRTRHSALRWPIVALTAAALVSERNAGFACGVDEFVTKPIDVQPLWLALAGAGQPHSRPRAAHPVVTASAGAPAPHAAAHRASITWR